MGQKVHPLGLRVGITKKHQSQWFARFNKYKYAQSVYEDHMLRQTLTKLFPQLINPVLKKEKKRDEGGAPASSLVPRITQIKIERGSIPYEIGIQIHAENISGLIPSIENLKINRDFVTKFQKTRRYFQNLMVKFNEMNNTSLSEGTTSTLTSGNDSKESTNKKTMNRDRRSFGSRRFVRLTKQQLRRKRLILKRLKKRQSIRRRYKQFVYQGLFLTKKGNKGIVKFPSFGKNKNTFKKTKASFKNQNLKNRNEKGLKKDGTVRSVRVGGLSTMSSNTTKATRRKKQTTANVLQSRIKKKFVSIFINRMNKQFLQALKASLQEGNGSSLSTSRTMLQKGVNKKWNFKNVKRKLDLLSLTQCTSLISVCEKKCLKKMESLRKDFILFGTINKKQKEGYSQMLTFLKELKEYVAQKRRKQKFQYVLNNSLTKTGSSSMMNEDRTNGIAVENYSKFLVTAPSKNDTHSMNVLGKKLKNIENECRKIQFISYLKTLVQKHRSSNIYYYLSTISEAQKDLRNLKLFTKKHASFLFGGISLNSENIGKDSEEQNKLRERVRLVLEKSNKKSLFSKTLPDFFLEQIEKQRNMYNDNKSLTPKISIKFYQVKSTSLKAKASVIADSVVDALEQRKAFRKVIKDSKESLMRTSGVKGVKIQVAGRLNGAEIARSEWVRAGRVPLQTLRANLDYAYKTANTIYGIIGVKVWIFKGYTKLI